MILAAVHFEARRQKKLKKSKIENVHFKLHAKAHIPLLNEEKKRY